MPTSVTSYNHETTAKVSVHMIKQLHLHPLDRNRKGSSSETVAESLVPLELVGLVVPFPFVVSLPIFPSRTRLLHPTTTTTERRPEPRRDRPRRFTETRRSCYPARTVIRLRVGVCWFAGRGEVVRFGRVEWVFGLRAVGWSV